MKISDVTLTILKNLALFNPHLVVNAGNVIRTVNEKKTTLIKAVVEEEFPVDFAFHDLPGFLKLVGLFEDPDFEFGDHSVVITDASGASQEYYYSDRENLVYDERNVEFPEADHTFGLTADTLSKVLKGAAVNGVEDIAFVGAGGKVTVKALDKEKPKRTFSVPASEEGLDLSGDFNVYLKHSKKGGSKLTLLPLDYIVEISAAKIIQFSASVEGVQVSYIMAVEADSEV